MDGEEGGFQLDEKNVQTGNGTLSDGSIMLRPFKRLRRSERCEINTAGKRRGRHTVGRYADSRCGYLRGKG